MLIFTIISTTLYVILCYNIAYADNQSSHRNPNDTRIIYDDNYLNANNQTARTTDPVVAKNGITNNTNPTDNIYAARPKDLRLQENRLDNMSQKNTEDYVTHKTIVGIEKVFPNMKKEHTQELSSIYMNYNKMDKQNKIFASARNREILIEYQDNKTKEVYLKHNIDRSRITYHKTDLTLIEVIKDIEGKFHNLSADEKSYLITLAINSDKKSIISQYPNVQNYLQKQSNTVSIYDIQKKEN